MINLNKKIRLVHKLLMLVIIAITVIMLAMQSIMIIKDFFSGFGDLRGHPIVLVLASFNIIFVLPSIIAGLASQIYLIVVAIKKKKKKRGTVELREIIHLSLCCFVLLVSKFIMMVHNIDEIQIFNVLPRILFLGIIVDIVLAIIALNGEKDNKKAI